MVHGQDGAAGARAEQSNSGQPSTGHSGADHLSTNPVPADRRKTDEQITEHADSDQTDQLRRALADLANLRRRFAREVEREREEERRRIVVAFLPIVDDLDRTLAHAEIGSDQSILEGIRAVRNEAEELLLRLGFPRFEDVGQPFDARRHEVLGTVSADRPSGTVVAAIRPGYGTSETVLRPATVVVSQGPG